MPKGQKLQTNFNAGILSPYIEGRPDVAQFYNGGLTMRNVVLLPEGGFESSPGTLWKWATKSNGQVIMLGFQPTDDTAFEIEMGVGYFRFAKNGERVMMPGSELILDGGFDDPALANWTDSDTGSGVSSRTTFNGEPCLRLFVGATAGLAARNQFFSVVAGSTYSLTFTVLSGFGRVKVERTVPSFEELHNNVYTPGTYTIQFTPSAGTSSVAVTLLTVNPINTVVLFDSLSCKIVGGVPYEISSPYTLTNLREIQGGQGIRQINDKVFICCSSVRPKELIYGGDTNWTLADSPFDPMPSYEADTDISGGTITLTPAATTGSGINFHASSSVFLAGDVGRVIKYGLSRALITTVTDGDDVVCEILVAFPDTNPIPAGQWLLEGSPGGSTFDVPNKQPVGRVMNGTFNVATARSADVGKFIKVYGGVLEVIKVNSSTSIQVKIVSELTDSEEFNPAAAPAGSWRLEQAAWSDELGWPTLNEFLQSRYALASNANQRTTKWMSRTNNFYNFAVGTLATDAVEYTHRSGRFGPMRWMVENEGGMFFADGWAVNSLKGKGVDEPVGGDTVPFQRAESRNGAALMRPLRVGNSLLFFHWTQRRIYALAYSFERDAQIPRDLTFLCRHLPVDVPRAFPPGMVAHEPGYVEDPHPLVYCLRNDGVALVLSFNDDPQGGNSGWTTLELAGEIESYCVTRRNNSNVLTLVVKRTLIHAGAPSGETVRYIEEIRRDVHDKNLSVWTELQTQSAKVIFKTDTSSQDTFGDLGHLKGKTVDILLYRNDVAFGAGGGIPQTPRYLGQKTVSDSGEITLNEPIDYPAVLEIGIPFIPFVKTMRAAIANTPTDGHLRRWTKCGLRLYKSALPTVNGTDMQLHKGMDAADQGPFLRSGDFFVSPDDMLGETKWDWSLNGYLDITRSRPYPICALMLYGEVEFSQSMAEATGNEGIVHVPA